MSRSTGYGGLDQGLTHFTAFVVRVFGRRHYSGSCEWVSFASGVIPWFDVKYARSDCQCQWGGSQDSGFFQRPGSPAACMVAPEPFVVSKGASTSGPRGQEAATRPQFWLTTSWPSAVLDARRQSHVTCTSWKYTRASGWQRWHLLLFFLPRHCSLSSRLRFWKV